jgi:hypothetical protein
MKTVLPIVLAALLAGAPPGAVAAGEVFMPIRPDYKKPQEVPENFFDPFRAQDAADSGSFKRDAAMVSDGTVASAVGTRGISGILLGAKPAANRVIIGDQVFAVGDALQFPDNSQDGFGPLVAGASVVLQAVQRESLVLEIQPDGRASRELIYSLGGFWRP